MFLALRELSFARGRFALMGSVVALIAILMVLLSGLSVGLVNDGVRRQGFLEQQRIFDPGYGVDRNYWKGHFVSELPDRLPCSETQVRTMSLIVRSLVSPILATSSRQRMK